VERVEDGNRWGVTVGERLEVGKGWEGRDTGWVF